MGLRQFEEQMERLLGKEEFGKYQQSMIGKSAKGVVLNTNLESAEQILKVTNIGVNKLSFCDYGYKLLKEEKLGNTWFHHAGLIYLQEPSSMAPASMFLDLTHKRVLDLCASPGGKTVDLALRMNGSGLIVSNEIVGKRAGVLFSNVERLGLGNVVVTNNSPKELEDEFESFFDCILVDAPCSGEGMFRKNPDQIQEWSVASVKACAIRQKEILKSAYKMLTAGGYMVYSTCTFNTIENEEVILFAKNELGLKIIKPDDKIIRVSHDGKILNEEHDLAFCRRFYPQDGVGEGQFMCLLQKNDSSFAKNEEKLHNSKNKIAQKLQKPSKQEQNLIEKFIHETTDGLKFEHFVKIKDNIFGSNFGEILDKDASFISCGVNIGKIEKGRVIPHHQFFKVCGKFFKFKIELDEKSVVSYLKGEEIEVNSNLNGFVCVTKDGFVLGGGKVSLSRLKNYYPKGLRAVTDKIW